MKAGDLFTLRGETALVTGASTGLGAHLAGVLAANGARVALVARRRDELDARVAAIVEAKGTAIAVTADVTTEAGIRFAFDAAEKAFGTVTILVNNAGQLNRMKALEETRESWAQMMTLNLEAQLFCSQEAARRMIAAKKSGAIVNIASVLGLRAQMGIGAYATAKAGAIQMTRALALEWAGHGIRVNAIAPGIAMTDHNRDYLLSPAGQAMLPDIPMARFGEDGDFDGALLLLASRAGRFMTGETIVVDGGHSVPL